jgi:hypothetical protein
MTRNTRSLTPEVSRLSFGKLRFEHAFVLRLSMIEPKLPSTTKQNLKSVDSMQPWVSAV